MKKKGFTTYTLAFIIIAVSVLGTTYIYGQTSLEEPGEDIGLQMATDDGEFAIDTFKSYLTNSLKLEASDTLNEVASEGGIEERDYWYCEGTDQPATESEVADMSEEELKQDLESLAEQFVELHEEYTYEDIEVVVPEDSTTDQDQTDLHLIIAGDEIAYMSEDHGLQIQRTDLELEDSVPFNRFWPGHGSIKEWVEDNDFQGDVENVVDNSPSNYDDDNVFCTDDHSQGDCEGKYPEVNECQSVGSELDSNIQSYMDQKIQELESIYLEDDGWSCSYDQKVEVELEAPPEEEAQTIDNNVGNCGDHLCDLSGVEDDLEDHCSDINNPDSCDNDPSSCDWEGGTDYQCTDSCEPDGDSCGANCFNQTSGDDWSCEPITYDEDEDGCDIEERDYSGSCGIDEENKPEDLQAHQCDEPGWGVCECEVIDEGTEDRCEFVGDMDEDYCDDHPDGDWECDTETCDPEDGEDCCQDCYDGDPGCEDCTSPPGNGGGNGNGNGDGDDDPDPPDGPGTNTVSFSGHGDFGTPDSHTELISSSCGTGECFICEDTDPVDCDDPDTPDHCCEEVDCECEGIDEDDPDGLEGIGDDVDEQECKDNDDYEFIEGQDPDEEDPECEEDGAVVNTCQSGETYWTDDEFACGVDYNHDVAAEAEFEVNCVDHKYEGVLGEDELNHLNWEIDILVDVEEREAGSSDVGVCGSTWKEDNIQGACP